MIHVSRKRVPRPAFLDSAAVRAEANRVAEFYAAPGIKRRQLTLAYPKIYTDRPVVAALLELFQKKCAFCESPISRADSVAAHFRPAEGSTDETGKFSPEHYWWLGLVWENLYAECANCIRAKGLRFPVEGSRAAVGAPYDKVVETERPLLLDPCVDDPEEELVFSEDGKVASATRRGIMTIDVFALNRDSLITARAAAIAESLEHASSKSQIEKLVPTSLPYSAARRQALQRARTEAPSRATANKVKLDFAKHEAAAESYSVEADAPAEHYFLKSRMIERIELENFRIFRDLRIALTPATETAPWTMLLGENGLGKSTLLQALALTLMGPKLRTRFGFKPASFLRHGATSGSVRVYVTGVERPLELLLTRRAFEGNDPAAKVLLLGYGSTRLFGNSPKRQIAASHARVHNLFDPFSTLLNPTEFFRQLKPARRDAAARTVKELLDIDREATIKAAKKEMIIARADGSNETFDELSDGYRAMLALASDIMNVLFAHWPDMSAAEGIVLIDELENHLHPRWKMRVVESLRKSFPRIQFIATTHDPLCLRGLHDGEVVVLQRDGDGSVFARTDLPPVKGLRVDQLLTSEHFGLSSTIDPSVEKKFERYYELIAKTKLESGEEDERVALKHELATYTVLGGSRRDQLALEAIDEFLAKERHTPDESTRRALNAQTKKRIASLWKDTQSITP